jgi:hypothetical protein
MFAAAARVGTDRRIVMSASINKDPDLAVLQDELAALKRDVVGLNEHLKSGAANGARAAANHLDGVAEGSVRALERQIETQPLVALLIALGVGYIGGRVLSR